MRVCIDSAVPEGAENAALDPRGSRRLRAVARRHWCPAYVAHAVADVQRSPEKCRQIARKTRFFISRCFSPI